MGKRLISPTFRCGDAAPPVRRRTSANIRSEFIITVKYSGITMLVSRRNSIIRCPRHVCSPSGIIHAIPNMPPSRLYTTSPGLGSSRSIRFRYVSSETNRTESRFSFPGLKFDVRRHTIPESAHFGVLWGQSTILIESCSGDARVHSFGMSIGFRKTGGLGSLGAALSPTLWRLCPRVSFKRSAAVV